MDIIQKQIISLLRKKNKPLYVSYIENTLSANRSRIDTAIDELHLKDYLNVIRSSNGVIKKVSLLEEGNYLAPI
jgi:DNA-binding MarR family transcriptional regulator